jgi:hypothetical protein
MRIKIKKFEEGEWIPEKHKNFGDDEKNGNFQDENAIHPRKKSKF